MSPHPPITSRVEACEAREYRRAARIQPHGWFLAFDPATMRLARISANANLIPARPAAALIGTGLAELFDPPSLHRIEAVLRAAPARRRFLALRANAAGAVPCTGLLYRSGPLYCLEIEPPRAARQNAAPDIFPEVFLAWAEQIAGAAVPSAALAGIVCDALREATRFDRIYFCRFDTHGHGHVLAESRGSALPSLLDHRFPATDIPWTVRAMYDVNPFRLIGDVNAAPVDILGGDGAALDLAPSMCRTIAPSHLTYLRNMGVGASLSFAMVGDDGLEAIFGGHHATEAAPPWQSMAACQHFVELFKARFAFLKLREERRAADIGAAAVQALAASFRTAPRNLGAFAAARLADFAALAAADDVICRFEGKLYGGASLAGHDIAALVNMLASQLESGVDLLPCDCLAALDPALESLAPAAAGALVMPLDLARANLLIWLRRETIIVETWSGDPHRALVGGADGAIGPRMSFEAYQREMKGRCLAWQPYNIALARRVRHAFDPVLAAHYEAGMRAAAEQANALKSEFVANIGHELRSPMHAILGLSDVMSRDDPAMTKQRRTLYAATIRDSGQRLLGLIDDLLDLSRLEAGRMTFNFAAPDLADTLRRAIAEMAPLAAAANITLRHDAVPDQIACVHDAARMQQVMVNLLSNAIKFGSSGQTVTISAGRATREGPLRIEVADQGPGIPDGELEIIFDKFVQSSRTVNGAGGTGLGLSISRQIVHAHGGRLSARNNPAAGASLVIELMPTALVADSSALPPAGGGLCPPAPPTGVPPASQIGLMPICDAGGTPVGVQGAKPPVAEGNAEEPAA